MKNKNININIPNPCSYGWDKMTLNADSEGRHCKACDKIVVDFTKLTTEQIILFLEKNKGTRTCGHFKTIDTTVANWYHRPFLKLYSHIENNYKKNLMQIAGLFLIGSILFLTGCKEKDRYTDGEYHNPEDTLMQIDTSFYVDTTKNMNSNSNSDNYSDTLQSK